MVLNISPILLQPGIREIYSVSGEIQRYYFSVSDLALVLGGICGLLGGLRVYHNWQIGQRHIDAQITAWLFSCIFLSILSIVLKAFFSI